MNKIKLIFVNILVFLILFVITDLTIGFFNSTYDFNNIRRRHSYYHHSLKKNKDYLASWGKVVYPIKTNSLGFRDSSVYEVPDESTNYKILFMGDSHTEGVGVPFKKTFTGLIQDKARGFNIDILNAAAVSYSPLIHYLKLSYLIHHQGFIPDEIFIFVDISDMQNEIAYESFTPKVPDFFGRVSIAFKDFLNNHSFFYTTIYNYVEQKKTHKFVERMKDFDDYEYRIHQKDIALYRDFFSEFDDDDLLRSPEFHGVGQWYMDSSTIKLAEKGLYLGQRNIGKVKKLCDSFDIKLNVSVHPWQIQNVKRDTNDLYVKSWRNFCLSNKINFVNLFPVFINSENPVIINHKCYIRNDNHWNIFGHKRVADYLFDNYLHNKWKN